MRKLITVEHDMYEINDIKKFRVFYILYCILFMKFVKKTIYIIVFSAERC